MVATEGFEGWNLIEFNIVGGSVNDKIYIVQFISFLFLHKGVALQLTTTQPCPTLARHPSTEATAVAKGVIATVQLSQ